MAEGRDDFQKFLSFLQSNLLCSVIIKIITKSIGEVKTRQPNRKAATNVCRSFPILLFIYFAF